MTAAVELESVAAVVDALRLRFPAPAWCLFTEVANGTGAAARRRADAVAMSVWPSRGLELHGFEIKLQRNDVLREFKQPAKADEVARHLDRWWLVVGNAKIVAQSEVPPAWGLLVPAKSRAGITLKIVKDAKHLKPKPVSREFLAALVRRVAERHDPEKIAQQARYALKAELREEVRGEVKTFYERELEDLREQLAAQRKVAEESASALRTLTEQPYSVPAVVRAVALLQKLGGWRGAIPALDRLEDSLQRDRTELGTVIETMRETKMLLQDLLPDEGKKTP